MDEPRRTWKATELKAVLTGGRAALPAELSHANVVWLGHEVGSVELHHWQPAARDAYCAEQAALSRSLQPLPSAPRRLMPPSERSAA